MLETATILFFSFGYMGFLFAIAYFGDKHAEMGRSLVGNPYIYALSLAVYCTAWTFYGSVGRAVRDGPGFLTIYIGPTLMAALGWLVLRKIIRISKIHHITSIADFIGSRYGKSTILGGVVTIIAVLGIVPYIALQLKAISTSYLVIKEYPEIIMPRNFAEVPVFEDTAFYVSVLLAVFSILFGTRHLETTERHEGMVAAIAFECVVKLIAFLSIGIFITYSLYGGFGDLFAKVRAAPEFRGLMIMEDRSGAYIDWGIYIFLSMTAVVFLPRQFHVAVVENVNEDHLNKAIWLFPLYLLAINIFVLPVALGGLLQFPEGTVDADTFVLTLPMAVHQEGLALLAYIGGTSAATGMVIVETVALSTMICNELVMPVLLRLPFPRVSQWGDMSGLLLAIRRSGIAVLLLLGYTYFRFIGEYYPLVSTGLVSFAAVAQFAPAILGGIFWKRSTRLGALWGMVAGFLVWAYTLFLPSLVQTGLLSSEFVTEGPWGIALLRPFQLFGLEGFNNVAHAVFWSMFVNVGGYIGVSLFTQPSPMEHTQAALFVDVFKPREEFTWRRTASVPDLKSLLERFLGEQRTRELLSRYADSHQLDWEKSLTADDDLISYAEKLLSGAIGSASARVMVASVVKEESLGIEEVMNILDETRQVIIYSKELERTTAELKAANERLKELDRLKDEFISTVTHELRTPLTSVRSIAEILHDTEDLDPDQHRQFLGIIIKESERLTRLINQVLDFQKMESGRMEWQMQAVDIQDVVSEAVSRTDRLVRDKGAVLRIHQPEAPVPKVPGDVDRLIQVMLNLISNAVKFCDEDQGRIDITLSHDSEKVRVDVRDNGIGISPEHQKRIFDKFHQIRNVNKTRPSGSGLGLSITRRIVEHHGGIIWVESEPGAGSTFSFELPIQKASDAE
jgi:Na+/proline symporter/nitrogen-specific signal transduction histidine kinase